MKALISLLFFSCSAFSSPADPALAPANPNASASAVAILKYFQRLSAAQTGKRLLSGQFTSFGRGADLRILSEIHDTTGHWPAIMGADYADWGKGSLTFKEPDKAAIDYWNQGGLVTISAHLYDPASTNGGGLNDKGVDLGSLLTDGTDIHTRWMQELDIIASGLHELKDAGVVVLWRPFHEMNGGWFWWGKKDPQTFIKVWRHMFDYFTKTKGLDNLLWVYAPNHGEGAAQYYPGDRYVDLVGLDAYTDFVDKDHILGYDEVVALPKPFGFTEYGPHGSQNPPGDYDYRQFLTGIEQNFPKTCFFMAWNGKWSLARNTNIAELLNSPRIANREDLAPEITSAGKSKAP